MTIKEKITNVPNSGKTPNSSDAKIGEIHQAETTNREVVGRISLSFGYIHNAQQMENEPTDGTLIVNLDESQLR